MSYERHRTLIGTLHLVLGVIDLVACAIVTLSLGGTAALARAQEVTSILGVAGAVTCTILLLAAAPHLVAACGVLGGREWGRTAAVVAAFLALPGLPVGTAVGAFTLWVVFGRIDPLENGA